MGAEVIGIDEGQFFDDVCEFSEEMANNGKVVLISALDGTFERKTFGNILNLIPMAEKVEKLDAVCMDCKNSASFTKRITSSKEIELIGGSDVYKPVCRRCFHMNEDDAAKLPKQKITPLKSSDGFDTSKSEGEPLSDSPDSAHNTE